jgi:hypothetical protein
MVAPEAETQNSVAVESPSTTDIPASLPAAPAVGEPVVSSTAPAFTPPQPVPINSDGVVPVPGVKENIYTEICSQIIKEQEKIIGALAIEQANQVTGLTVDPATYHCTVSGDGSVVIDDLIEQYRDFFGHAAVEVCKEAASRFISKLPAEELPSSLR